MSPVPTWLLVPALLSPSDETVALFRGASYSFWTEAGGFCPSFTWWAAKCGVVLFCPSGPSFFWGARSSAAAVSGSFLVVSEFISWARIYRVMLTYPISSFSWFKIRISSSFGSWPGWTCSKSTASVCPINLLSSGLPSWASSTNPVCPAPDGYFSSNGYFQMACFPSPSFGIVWKVLSSYLNLNRSSYWEEKSESTMISLRSYWCSIGFCLSSIIVISGF